MQYCGNYSWCCCCNLFRHEFLFLFLHVSWFCCLLVQNRGDWQKHFYKMGPMQGSNIVQFLGNTILSQQGVRKMALKKFFMYGFAKYRNFKIWRPLKQTKSKNGCHFFISTFENLQLCFFVQKDSSTLKALKNFLWVRLRKIDLNRSALFIFN